MVSRYFATTRFWWYTWWHRPKVKVTKVKVISQKNKHWHASKLLKLQSPSLVQRHFAAMRFTTYQTLWPWPKVKVTNLRVKGKKKLECFSETIEATVTIILNLSQRYFATMRLVTLTEGQGLKRSEKETFACFSETIEATVSKFGTDVLSHKALHNILHTVTLTEGQGHKGQSQR